MMLVSKGCMLHDSSCMTFRKRQNSRDGRRNSDCQRLSRSKKELICEMGDSLFFFGGGCAENILQDTTTVSCIFQIHRIYSIHSEP